MSRSIEAHQDGATLKLKLNMPRLDASAARGFKEDCEAVWSDQVSAVEINLSVVQFIDSSGIGALLSIYKKLPSGTPSVRLVEASPEVQSVIQLLRLHRIFELVE